MPADGKQVGAGEVGAARATRAHAVRGRLLDVDPGGPARPLYERIDGVPPASRSPAPPWLSHPGRHTQRYQQLASTAIAACRTAGQPVPAGFLTAVADGAPASIVSRPENVRAPSWPPSWAAGASRTLRPWLSRLLLAATNKLE